MLNSSSKRTLFYPIAAISLFTVVVAIVFIAHVATGTCSLSFERSISRYVGSTTWSALLFLVGNSIVGCFVALFLLQDHVPKLYRYFGALIILSLITISVFPTGLFGLVLIKQIHNVFARVLMISMAIHTLIGTISLRKRRGFLLPNLIILALDAAAIVIALFFTDFFWEYTFAFEMLLIYAYFVSMLTVAVQCDRIEKERQAEQSRERIAAT